jgi:glycosyltransferase involved in cell wall biosynthesis
MAPDTKVALTDGRKRILYVITKANWGGAQRYVFDLATEAKDRGHEVLVITGAEGILTQKLREGGIEVESIARMKRDISLKAEVAAFRSLLASIRRFRPDIVHANSSKAGGLASLASRLAGVPLIVFTAHAWAYNEGRPLFQKALIALFHYGTVLLAHKTICVSEAVRKEASWMPAVRNRFIVIHNGIAPGTLLERIDARDRLSPEFIRLYPGLLWIGTIAELHPSKGLDTLIEAFAHLGPEAVLVIIGGGQELGRLEKLSQIHGVGGRVLFAGFIDGAPSLLKAFDIFALPSRSEAFGTVLLEAGLASLPVVASDVGGIPEVLKNEESGILLPPSDSEELTAALDTLVRSEEARTKLGNALRERVLRVFSAEKMLRETFAAYADAR